MYPKAGLLVFFIGVGLFLLGTSIVDGGGPLFAAISCGLLAAGVIYLAIRLLEDGPDRH